MARTLYVIYDICTACGRDAIDNDSICETCKSKLSECNNCRYKDTIKCLTCDNWQYANYKTKEG